MEQSGEYELQRGYLTSIPTQILLSALLLTARGTKKFRKLFYVNYARDDGATKKEQANDERENESNGKVM